MPAAWSGQRFVLRTVCQRGLHPMTSANTVYEAGGTIRRCFMCRSLSLMARLRRHHKPRPLDTGLCMKGLHPWLPENWLLRDEKNGRLHARCRPCTDATHAAIYARTRVIPYLVKGCERATHWQPRSRCSRRTPPEWVDAN